MGKRNSVRARNPELKNLPEMIKIQERTFAKTVVQLARGFRGGNDKEKVRWQRQRENIVRAKDDERKRRGEPSEVNRGYLEKANPVYTRSQSPPAAPCAGR